MIKENKFFISKNPQKPVILCAKYTSGLISSDGFFNCGFQRRF